MHKKIAWGGIDPGLTGCTCLLTEDEIHFHDWDGEIRSAFKIQYWVEKYDVKFCLEQINDVRKKGFNVPGKLLTNYGFWRGVLTTLNCNWISKTPNQWQKIMPGKRRKNETTKERAMFYAKKYYPEVEDVLNLKKDHNRADALLMAHFLRQTEIGV